MDGSLIENSDEISKELNKHFLSIFSQEESDRELEPVQIFRGQEVDKLSEIVISREVVSKGIDRLKKTKSPGPDDIFPRILKECRGELVEPIAMIFRKSLDTGVKSDLRPREQCIIARNRKNKILGFISRCVTNRSSEVLLRLYLALVRPHLDYVVQF